MKVVIDLQMHFFFIYNLQEYQTIL